MEFVPQTRIVLVMIRWETRLEQLQRDDRLPIVVTIFVLLLLLYAVWQTAMVFLDMPFAKKIAATPARAAAISTPVLADLHLFGVYAGNLDALPDTRLQLSLEGTVITTIHPGFSRAMIASADQPAKVYRAGDTLPDNVTITRIATNYVVIDNNGALEKIPLPVEQLSLINLNE